MRPEEITFNQWLTDRWLTINILKAIDAVPLLANHSMCIQPELLILMMEGPNIRQCLSHLILDFCHNNLSVISS